MTKASSISVRSCVLAAGLFASLLSGNASAKHNGNVCNPIKDDVDIVDRNQYGVFNTSTSETAHVVCPIDKRTGGSEESGNVLSAVVYDRNSSAEISCTFFILDNNGNSVSGGSDTKHTTGSGSSSMELGFFNITASETGNMVVICDIPPAQSGSFSHIAGFHWIIS